MKNGRRAWLLALLIFLSLVVFLRRVYVDRRIPPMEQSGESRDNKRNGTAKQEDDRTKLNRNVSMIIYTRHAKCRMDCRSIDTSEVKEILIRGEVNYQKSDLRSSPDPRYALEGKTHDGQHVRIIFANAPGGPVVITVIDLEKEWYCDCK